MAMASATSAMITVIGIVKNISAQAAPIPGR